jgi:mannan endo-1,4-beta-mannosidase
MPQSARSFKLIVTLTLLTVTLSFDSLVTPDASPEAIALHRSLTTNYDKYILSGQTTFNYDDFVTKTSGELPLVRGFDMQNYSPHNPWFNWQPYDDGTVDRAIKWYQDTKGKGVVTFFWHWFSPMGG